LASLSPISITAKVPKVGFSAAFLERTISNSLFQFIYLKRALKMGVERLFKSFLARSGRVNSQGV
jgi:hypothetical protein